MNTTLSSIHLPRIILFVLLTCCMANCGAGNHNADKPANSTPPPTPSALSHWIDKGVTGKTICFVGDSTTASAAALFQEFNNFYTKEGEGLYGIVPILNYGENGASLSAFLTNIVTHGITATVATQADLYVISYGINDVRLGQTTEDQLVSLLRDAVDRIRTGAPKADIVLRMPNSLLSSDVGGYAYVQPNSSAQAYSTILRNAYLRLENQWSNVVVLDTQDSVFGRDSLPSSTYMADQLHPSATGYVLLAKVLVDVIGPKQPFDPKLADAARKLKPSAPYSVYPRAVEDPKYYELVATGRWDGSSVVGAANGYVDFVWAHNRLGEIHCGDLLQMARDHVFVLPPTCNIAPIGANTRIYNLGGTLPPITMTGGTVNVWRAK